MAAVDQPPPPNGYEYTGTGTEIRLVDPLYCPAGHPALLTRRGWGWCGAGHRHHSWDCACGLVIWRADDAFVDTLPCQPPEQQSGPAT